MIDPGSVQLVYSDHGPPDGPKQAMLEGMVLPLARLVQAILLTLPLAQRKRVLPGIDLDLFDLMYSYVSLNVFWDRAVADRSTLNHRYWHHLGPKPQQVRRLHADLHSDPICMTQLPVHSPIITSSLSRNGSHLSSDTVDYICIVIKTTMAGVWC